MNTPLYIIRPLDFKDLAILEAHFPEPKKHSHAKRLKAQNEGRQTYNAIVADGTLAGVQLIRWTGPTNADHRKLSPYPEIGSLYILPQFRKQGLASALLTHSEHLIQKNGFSHAGLIIKDDNLASITLHLKLGYNPIGPAHPAANDPDTPRTYYTKRLG